MAEIRKKVSKWFFSYHSSSIVDFHIVGMEKNTTENYSFLTDIWFLFIMVENNAKNTIFIDSVDRNEFLIIFTEMGLLHFLFNLRKMGPFEFKLQIQKFFFKPQ